MASNEGTRFASSVTREAGSSTGDVVVAFILDPIVVSASKETVMFLRRSLSIGAMALALVLGVGQLAHASAIIPSAFNTSSLAGNDDGSTGFVNFGFTAALNFNSVAETGAFLNNNGNITFLSANGTFTPSAITGGSLARLAPYFADVDTRPAGSPLMTYGEGTFDSHDAFGVNWVGVGYFSNSFPNFPNRLSTQLVIVDRSDIAAGDFDFMFNYDLVQWEAGTASSSDSSGCGGTSAHAGWTNGAGSFFELPGSGVHGAFLDSGTCVSSPGPNALILHSLNSDILGRYLFSVREGQVEQPPSDVPEPASLLLLGTGMVALVRRRMRARKQ